MIGKIDPHGFPDQCGCCDQIAAGAVTDDDMFLCKECLDQRAVAIQDESLDADLPSSGPRNEAYDFCRDVYEETGVTPDLRRAFDFYRKNYLTSPPPSALKDEAAVSTSITKDLA